MTVEILLSCMHLNNDNDVMQLISRSNIKSKAVVVSQCDKDAISICGKTKIIYTTERGLSRSRNMALRHSTGDICLISDDDEIFADNVEDIIKNAYAENPEASLIAFALNRQDCNKTYPTMSKPLRFRQILKTSSHQISFRKSELKKYGIKFDEMMGSGTGNGGGEENKFLLDFRRHKRIMRYNPNCIATILPGESQWFHGYDARFLSNFGWSSRRAMGLFTGLAYIHYWTITHYRLYSSNFNLPTAYRYILKGFLSRK